jgi:hypothetical protein
MTAQSIQPVDTQMQSAPAGYLDQPVRYVLTRAAVELLDGSPAPRARCASCRQPVALLVDDSGLCIDCDSLWFPGLQA